MTNGVENKIESLRERVKHIEHGWERKRLEWLEEMKQELEEIDREALELFRATHPGYRNKGLTTYKLLSNGGVIKARLHRVVHRTSHKSISPLWWVMGRKMRWTDELSQKLLAMVIHVPYALSAELVEKVLGIRVGKMRLWRKVQEQGQQLQKEYEQETAEIFEQGKDRDKEHEFSQQLEQQPVVLESDGCLIPIRRQQGQVEVTEAVTDKRLGEVKVGCMFRGVVQSSKRRMVTVGLSVYANLERLRTFGEQFYAFVRRRGYRPELSTTYVSDAAAGLGELQKDHFPTAVAVLDLYHLKRTLQRVLSLQQMKMVLERLFSHRVQEALDFLERWAAHQRSLKGLAREVLDYVKANRDAIAYGGHLHNGSGVVEKMVDILVKRRFKRQGMSWSEPGARNLLLLRVQYYQQRYDQRTRRLLASARTPRTLPQ